ncbi:MAG TPA: phosphotransferase family protein [Acidimicrobiales bacterium]
MPSESEGSQVTGTAPAALRRSSRDRDVIRRRLEAWLAGRTAGPPPTVPVLEGTSATGMSSETLLFDVAWDDGRTDRLVARVAPDPGDVPVFPRYELGHQYAVLRAVGDLTAVPVPAVRWNEPDPSHLGAPFFVMERVDGRVPPDVMPYNFGDSWLYAAPERDQRRLQDAVVAVLAELHAVDRAEERFPFLQRAHPGPTPLRRHVAATRAWYEWAAGDDLRSDLIERLFAWLDHHWPRDEGPTVLSWGDARIGNIIFGDDMAPAAVLDWEMAGLGPRELDVGWLVYSHRIFEDFANALDLPGMPHLLRAGDVSATYEQLTDHAIRDLPFYGTYAALQYAIVFLRTGRRQVHFGEVDPPASPDDLILNRDAVERMLDGSYWS